MEQPMRALYFAISAILAIGSAGTFAMGTSQPPIHLAALIGTEPAAQSTAPQPQSDSELASQHLRNRQFDKALEIANQMVQANPKDPDGYNLQGGAYMGKGDTVAARKSFDAALKLQPDNYHVLMNLAQLDRLENNVAGSRKRYQAVLAKDPKNLPALMGVAQLEAVAGNAKEATGWLQKAKAAHPTAAEPRILLASNYLQSKDYSRAVAELSEAQLAQPDNADVLNLLAQAQFAEGKRSDAVATYKKLVAARPKLPVAYFRLAAAQAAIEDYAGATESLRAAVRLKPDFSEAVAALAALEIRAGRPAEAMKLAKDLQNAAPTAPDGLALEGDVLAAQGQYGDAARAYEKAYAVRPEAVVAAKYHAAQTRAGITKGAETLLQDWLKKNPNDVDTLQHLATQNLLAGQNKLAIERFEQVLKKSPNDVAALNNLAMAYHREKNPSALATAERAYKLAPDSAVVADTLGLILVDQGSTKRGLELLRRAAAKDPKSPEIQYHLAMALGKAGDKAQARRVLENLLAGDQKFPQREAAQQLLKQL
jgi:putative PEP-CTERM system TPR-repeat lipoprotein